MKKDHPSISVIVPVFNGESILARCLDAINASSYRSYELLVVDDCSADHGAEICQRKGARVLRMERRSGPAAARNYGAERARGEILFFVDADVLVRADSMSLIAEDFADNPGVAAVFGSYDDDPAERNFLSQYKNLYHHFIHQRSRTEAGTFWAGCGAVRKTVFSSVGGFDEKLYSRPCIEDIELGYRLRRLGHRILLDKSLQCKHLKTWRWYSLLRADIFYRALPWSRLILHSGHQVNDLNLRTNERISAGAVALSAVMFAGASIQPRLLATIPLLFLTIVALNYKMYAFFLERRGLIFAARAFLMQLLHYSYSGAVFSICWCAHIASGLNRETPGKPRP